MGRPDLATRRNDVLNLRAFLFPFAGCRKEMKPVGEGSVLEPKQTRTHEGPPVSLRELFSLVDRATHVTADLKRLLGL